jgi:hypothetical protein
MDQIDPPEMSPETDEPPSVAEKEGMNGCLKAVLILAIIGIGLILLFLGWCAWQCQTGRISS